jgi:hypothetical protein
MLTEDEREYLANAVKAMDEYYDSLVKAQKKAVTAYDRVRVNYGPYGRSVIFFQQEVLENAARIKKLDALIGYMQCWQALLEFADEVPEESEG